MSKKIKILIAEHDQADLDLMQSELKLGGIDFISEIVQCEADFINALFNFEPDIILSDYTFPSFDGQRAFSLVKKISPDIPFIVVTGTIGEEKSVELIKNGVTDYVLKDKLFTLNFKVERALLETAERKLKTKADLELLQSEKKYRQVVETAQEGIWLIDENNITTLVNKKMTDMLGYSKEEMIGRENYFFMDDEWKEKAVGHIVSRKLGINEEHEFKYIAKSGKEVYTNISTNPVFDEAGTYKGALAMVTDITERKAVDAEIKESELRYRTLFEQNLTGIYQSSMDGRILDCNEAFAKMLKYNTAEELLSINAFDLYFTRGERDHFICDLQSQKTLTNYEAVLKCKDGSRLNVLENNSLRIDRVSGESFCDGVLIDITERKKTEQEIGWMINNTEESFILLNRKLEITSFNNRAQQLYSKYLDRQLVKGVAILDYAQPARVDTVRAIYKKVLNGYVETDEIIIPLPGDATKIFLLKYKPAKDDHNIIIGAFVSAIDITEQKEAAVQKDFERRNKEALINTTTDLIWSLTCDFRLIAANQAFLDNLKNAVGIILKPGDELMLDGKYPESFLALWKNLYLKALNGTSFIEEIHTAAWGESAETWAETRFNPIYNDDAIVGVACYTRDTTASKTFKNKLVVINKKLETAQKIANLGYWELDMDIYTLYWSAEVYNIWAVTPDNFELNFTNFYDTIHPDDKGIFDESQKNALDGKEEMDIEHRIILTSGKIKYVHEKGELVYNADGKPVRFEGTVQDITERKELENLLNSANKMARIGSWEIDLIKNTLFWSDVTKEIHETGPGFIPDIPTAINFYKEGESRELITQIVKEAMEKNLSWDREFQIITAKGNEKWVRAIGQTEFANGKCIKIYGSFQDIDLQKRTEFAVNVVLEEKKAILESIDDAFFAIDKNWIVTYWNSQAEKVLGKSKVEMLGNNLWEIFPDRVDSESYKKYYQAIRTNQSVHFEDYYPLLSTWYEISAYPSGSGLSVYFKDVSERKLSEIRLKELNANLQKKAKELAISNAELEQFAYVASHDLQEPLRMVTSFLAMLEKKYAHVLDEKGKKYIGFAVDGAKRMRQIILDLLDFSRVGIIEDKMEDVDLNDIIEEIKLLFKKQTGERGAFIHSEILPVIPAHKTPLRRIFQNLVSNALKYRRKEVAPQIHISVEEQKDQWQFSIADNGIGIEEEYFDKIFIIFQRLHNKDEFSGTGMGLAITKKIIESEGGKIWVSSEEGKGSIFYFTLLKHQ